MSTHGFYATIHMDRFSDLILVVGDHVVAVELCSMGEDSTVDVHIEGESEVAHRLDRSLQKISHILSAALN